MSWASVLLTGSVECSVGEGIIRAPQSPAAPQWAVLRGVAGAVCFFLSFFGSVSFFFIFFDFDFLRQGLSV